MRLLGFHSLACPRNSAAGAGEASPRRGKPALQRSSGTSRESTRAHCCSLSFSFSRYVCFLLLHVVTSTQKRRCVEGSPPPQALPQHLMPNLLRTSASKCQRCCCFAFNVSLSRSLFVCLSVSLSLPFSFSLISSQSVEMQSVTMNRPDIPRLYENRAVHVKHAVANNIDS